MKKDRVPAEAVDTTPLSGFVTWRNASAEIECWNPFFYRNFHK